MTYRTEYLSPTCFEATGQEALIQCIPDSADRKCIKHRPFSLIEYGGFWLQVTWFSVQTEQASVRVLKPIHEGIRGIQGSSNLVLWEVRAARPGHLCFSRLAALLSRAHVYQL